MRKILLLATALLVAAGWQGFAGGSRDDTAVAIAQFEGVVDV